MLASHRALQDSHVFRIGENNSPLDRSVAHDNAIAFRQRSRVRLARVVALQLDKGSAIEQDLHAFARCKPAARMLLGDRLGFHVHCMRTALWHQAFFNPNH
ncbi:hypothetical protein D9M72_407230 [compost metagenome]